MKTRLKGTQQFRPLGVNTYRFFNVLPTNQTAITAVALCQNKSCAPLVERVPHLALESWDRVD
jgi:hypothetical protein